MSEFDNNCPLCSIPQKESVLYQDDKLYLASTKDLKGHKVRVMAVIKRHSSTPTIEEKLFAESKLIEHMQQVMGYQDWYIVSDKFASIPEHFHVMACDFPLEEESDPLFAKTPKTHFCKPKPKIMIGIPAFNEEDTVGQIVTKAKMYGDVFVVDDGSTDDTMQVAFEAGTKIIRHNHNLGYGSSLLNLFFEAEKNGYDVLVTLDADGQHDPSEIPDFIKALSNVDIVLGNRFKNHKNHTPFFRKLGIKVLSNLNFVGDAQCGFRAYNKKAIHEIWSDLDASGMGASVEILQIMRNKNLDYKEIPCVIKYGDGNKHSENTVSHGLGVLKTFFWKVIWEKPTKYLVPLNFVFLMLTLLSLFQSLNLYLQFHVVVLSWALLFVCSLISTILVFNILTTIIISKTKKGGL